MQRPPAQPAPAAAPPARHEALSARVEALETTFRHIAITRMRGVPVLNPALQVRAVGFAPLPGQPAQADARGWALGVLVTPWFMNVLRLPLQACTAPAPDSADGPVDVGRRVPRAVGAQMLDFVGAHDEQLGHYEQCSLFSPMFQFADQAAALATAHEVLRLLRAAPSAPLAPPRPPEQPPAGAPAPLGAPAVALSPTPAAVPAPARRGFLFGRPRTGA